MPLQSLSYPCLLLATIRYGSRSPATCPSKPCASIVFWAMYAPWYLLVTSLDCISDVFTHEWRINMFRIYPKNSHSCSKLVFFLLWDMLQNVNCHLHHCCSRQIAILDSSVPTEVSAAQNNHVLWANSLSTTLRNFPVCELWPRNECQGMSGQGSSSTLLLRMLCIKLQMHVEALV